MAGAAAMSNRVAAGDSRRAPVKKTVNIDADVYERIELWRKGQGPGGKDETWQEGLNIMARRGLATLTERGGEGPRKSAPVTPAMPAAPSGDRGGEGGETRPLEIVVGVGPEDMAVALRILSYLAACVPATQHNGRDRVVEREIVERFRQKVREQG